MRSVRIPLSAACLLVAVGVPSRAARAQFAAGDDARVAVEAEPLLFAQRGAGAGVQAAVGGSRRWSVGASLHAVDLPDRIRDLFFRDAEALDVRLTWAAGIDVRRRLGGAGSGWLVGVALGAEAFRARLDGAEDERANAFVAPHVGYAWRVARSRVYVYPRATVIALVDDERDRRVGGVAYALRPFAPNLQLRIGARF